MGHFESKSIDGEIYYDVFSKNTFNKVMETQKFMPLYSYEPEGVSKKIQTFFDTPTRLLEKAGIILSKVVEEDKAYFAVERQLYVSKNSAVKVRDDKIFVHEVAANDTIRNNMYYLIDGITSLFSTQFNIDLENVLKTIVPKLEIISKFAVVKVFSGNGFKGQMEFEKITYKNFETRKTVKGLMLHAQLKSSKTHMSDFEDFKIKLEKYCKEIMPLHQSKYQTAIRLTKG